MRIPTNDALAALGGIVVNREHLPATIAVSTDTREIRPSETFLALRGERFDGHRFVADAIAAGASAAIVDDAGALPDGQAGIVVGDTLAAYLNLGALARDRVRGPVIAISGSTGKTTTKTLAVRAFEAAGRPATATPENENNEIGVAKFLLSLDEGDQRPAIVEFGARKYRDLEPLVRAARPDIAVLTNIGDAHLEIMGSRERLAETKWGLFALGAQAVLNLADAVSRERVATLAAPPVWFGIDAERPPDGARAVIVRIDDLLAIAADETRALPLHVDLPGDYNRRNLAAALAAAWAVDTDPAAVTAAAPHFELPHGRYERMRIAGGPAIIYDAYNASMSGALATLSAFARERVGGRRIVVLGSMAELGQDAGPMHERVGAAAAESADIVLAGGAFATSLAAGARAAGLAPAALIAYQSNDEAIAWLREHVRPDDVVLLKGSRMYRMEQIVAGLSA
ncbi:MAG TPA: UDP-N-acetylmuramoyl-tripeptide--D-alanyl-D-alanine ligase [Candidatus Lustribacter sp.]|jgi:UDP-N-acetylmuramoyl-tripeptide--D-alanyl-D-alanine ligase|nr:UDP-N-acetylmuramoyl-tripeptide--D-alanyl-D-alanine ligase [Candidatus Lustribacter sp.]